MTFLGWLTIFGFAAILTVLAMPLGRYMAAVYAGERTFLDPLFLTPERLFYKLIRADPERGQDWKSYAKSLIVFSVAGWILLYFILRTQTLWIWTGLNPQGFHSAPCDVTFNSPGLLGVSVRQSESATHLY
jgi:K+-transporting ATPase ATPase A chain